MDGKVDPASDMETINTELILADLQTLENAIPRLEKAVKIKKGDAAQLETYKARAEDPGGWQTPSFLVRRTRSWSWLI